MANYIDMMKRWKDWRLGETAEQVLAEAIENETSLPFQIIGKSSLIIKGKKLSVKLVFSGNDLKDVVDRKKQKGTCQIG